MMHQNYSLQPSHLVLFLVLAGLPLLGICEVGRKSIGFEDLETSKDLFPVVRTIYTAISKGRKIVEGLPDHIVNDPSPRIVFISVGSGCVETTRVAMGAGHGLPEALARALQKLNILKYSEPGSELWMKLDVVKESRPIEEISWNRPIQFEPSLDGMAIESPRTIAFLPEELVAFRLINKKHRLNRSRVNRYIESHRNLNGSIQPFELNTPLKFRRFTCLSYFCDGKGVRALYRGHRRTTEITPEALLESARLGGSYLIRAVQPNGRFNYTYHPRTDSVSSDYNMVRHAGTIFAMMDLYKITKDPRLRMTAEKAIRYLIKYIKPYGKPDDRVSVLVSSNDRVKLGGVALAIVALVEYTQATGDGQYLDIAKRLARYILLSQKKNGRFIHKINYLNSKPSSFVSGYYPGEAELALVRLYTLDPQKQWLDSAERNAQYLIKVRDKGLKTKDLTHDHWLLYALNELHRLRPHKLYLNHASRIAKAIYTSQNRQGPYQDYPGSYYVPPRSTPTATRTEGLLAAYGLMKGLLGREKEANAIMEAIRWGISFQLGTQFRKEKALYMKNPGKCIGGFSRGLTNLDIRIDYVQHNISAMIGLYRILTADEEFLE